MAKTWNNIPEKKVLATLKEKSALKGTVSEKFDIYVDGAVPGGEGDVQGISMTIDPSTYVMTTQLKDGKGGNVGSPATIDLPLESMVVSGEYDEENKSIILTLKNGQTVEFSVADLVAGLQSEITPQNPLSADLVAETSNKNFVTNEEKEDISSISGLADDVETLNGNVEGLQSDVSGLNGDVNNLAGDVSTLQGDVAALQSDLGTKQDTIDGNNPLDASFIDDENSSKKLVTPEEKDALNSIVENDPSRLARFEDNGDNNSTALMDDAGNYLQFEANRFSQYGEVSGVMVNNSEWSYLIQNGAGSPINHFAGDDGATYLSGLPCGLYAFDADSMTLYVTDDKSRRITQDGTIIAGSEFDSKRTVTFIPADGSPATNYILDYNTGEVEEKTVGGSGGDVIYFNAESSGYILGVENIAFYKDAQLTEEMTPSEMFQLTNKGPVNLIGMFDDGSEFIPWSSEIIISAADDGMDGQGDSFFFRVLEGPTTGTVAYYGNQWHIGDKMIFLTAGEVDGLVKTGSGAPTTSTTGEKGQLYEDTTNGKVYVCTNRSGNTTTWKELVKAGDNISRLNNDSGYQNASQVSNAIASAVGDITSFEYQVVQTLPQTGEKGVVYLVPNSGTTPDIYDEYIWVNNAFEKIGTTDIDLSGYATTQDLEDGLATKANAIDPTDLPSGSTQNGVITTNDHTDIDPSAVSEGQIVVDSTENKVYIVSDITTDPQTGDPVIVWKEIQTDEMVILDYGTSTWSDFITAYNDNRIVYCRASSGTDPGVGDKTRMAFMAYITNPSNPTGVEFQYYRSVTTKSASNQTDQVVVYKLASNGTWTVETRNTNVKIAAGTNMTSSYSGGVLTLSADLSSKQDVIDSSHKLSADLIDSSTSNDKTYQTGAGAPTTSTAGSVGEMYVDKSTGTVYVCTSTTGGTYTWEPVSGGSGPTVVQTTGQSTTSVMSQKAVTDAIEAVDGVSITMTYTDPGEGSSLQANHFIAVYEA